MYIFNLQNLNVSHPSLTAKRKKKKRKEKKANSILGCER